MPRLFTLEKRCFTERTIKHTDVRILVLHNRYQFRGGEDLVFELEQELLRSYGNEVDTLLFNNDEIRSVFSKFRTGISLLHNSKSRRIIREKIFEFHPDIIHIHNLFPVASPSILFEAKRLGVPVVMTLHNYRLICPSATLLYDGKIYERSVHRIFPIHAIRKKLYRNSYVETAGVVWMTGIHKLLNTWNSKIATFIALTEFARQRFIHSSLKPPPENIVVKPNFTWDPGMGSTPRSDFFMYAGRLTPDKGLKLILKCVAELPDIRFRVVGDGPLRKEVEEYAEKYSNIQYDGFRDRNEVFELLRQSRALLMPSLSFEGFPMTILEAFATGTPVISSALGSMSEIVQDGHNGLLFKAGDLPEFMARIRLISQDNALAGRVSANARKSYETLYSPEVNYESLIRIYREAIEKTGKVKLTDPT
jgi:glycosyltransferase involved in cell wall biosynthesis